MGLPTGELTARDLLMRVRRLFTSGQWTRCALHKTRLTGKGKTERIDLYCTLGGLRHVAGLPVEDTPDKRHKAYWDVINLIADPDEDYYHKATARANRPGVLRRQQEAYVARKNDSAKGGVEGVLKIIDKAIEKASA